MQCIIMCSMSPYCVSSFTHYIVGIYIAHFYYYTLSQAPPWGQQKQLPWVADGGPLLSLHSLPPPPTPWIGRGRGEGDGLEEKTWRRESDRLEQRSPNWRPLLPAKASLAQMALKVLPGGQCEAPLWHLLSQYSRWPDESAQKSGHEACWVCKSWKLLAGLTIRSTLRGFAPAPG